MSEPPDSRRGKGRAEQKEENPDCTAQRCELLVRCRIESPDTIKSRASPEQSNRSKTRHDGTKEQENTDCSESWCLRSDSGIEPGEIVVRHLPNISQRRTPTLRRHEHPIRNLQILPHYQQLTLVEARQIRVSAPVFVRGAAES